MDRSSEETGISVTQAAPVQKVHARLARIGTALSALLMAMISATAAPAPRNAAAYRTTLLTIQQHMESGDLDGARTLLAHARRQFPEDGGLENLLGVVEIQQGHADAAKQAFSQAIRHSPTLVNAYLNLGRAYMLDAVNSKDAQVKALHVYEQALAIAPTNTEANYQAALLLMLAQSYQRSLDQLQKLDEPARNVPGALALLCADHAALRQKQESERAATALAAHPDLTEADATEILPVLRTAGRSDLAVQLLTAAAARAPLSPLGLRSLGLAQESTESLSNARQTLESAFAADPASTVTLVDLARVAHSQKDYQGALGYLAHARALAPTDAALPYYFGLVCLDLNLLGESRKALQEAVQLAPENPDYNFALGAVSAFAQDATLALPYLKKYHALRPQNPSGILAIGTTYFRAKDFDAAATWLRQAVANPKTAATAHYYLGRIARQQARLPDALTELNQAITLNPDQAEALAELGQVYAQTHNYPEAERQFSRALAIDADNYAANFGLLQLYARTGDSRREQQSKHFDDIKSQNETQYQEMMRIIEVRPQEGSAH